LLPQNVNQVHNKHRADTHSMNIIHQAKATLAPIVFFTGDQATHCCGYET